MKKTFRIFLTLFLLLSILPISSLAGDTNAGTGFKVTAERDGNDCNAEVQVPAGAEDCQPLVALYEPNGKLIAVKYAVKSQETSGAGTYQAQFPNAPENATVRAFLLSADKSPLSAPATNLTISDAQKVDEGKYRLTGGVYQDITIPESIGNGDVTLENVTIKGKLIVLGGGSNSIHLDGCSVDAIQVNKDVTAQDAEQPRIELKNTPVGKIEAVQPVTIEADSKSAVQTVEAKSDVTVQGARIETVTVPENVTTKPVITVTSGTVSTVEAKSETVVSGAENTVANVKAEAPVEVASETVVTVTVTVQVTVTVTGNSDVEVAVETTEAVEIAAESAQVSVSTTQTAEVSVQVNNTAVGYIHKWRETGRTDATCKTEGSVTYSCSCEGTCELGGTKTETLAKLPHKEVIDEAVAATCTETGLTAGKHCSECDAVLVEQTVIAALGHNYGAWIAEIPAGTEPGTKGHYHCDRCEKNFDTDKQELGKLVIPAIYASAATLEELAAAIENETLLGAVLAEDITVPGGTIPTGKTLIVPEGKTLTVTDILNVYGTLVNEGTLSNNGSIENRGEIEVRGTLANHGGIANQNTIFVFGGKLENHGVINGEWQPDENRWQSIISIENGGRIEGSFEGASIHDYIEAVDYWHDGEPVKCSWDAAFDPASGDFEVMAVAFGTEQIQAALNAMSFWGDETEQHSAHTYEAVIACGTKAAGADGSPVNTVQLGGIKVQPYQKLILCNWIAGSDLYLNDYVIGEGEKLTLSEGAGLECYNSGSRTLTIDGTIVNKGGYIDFGGMTVTGENAPIFVHSEDELIAALEQGGTIYLEFNEELVQENEGERRVTLANALTVGKDTELVNHFGSVLAIPGLTVNEGATLTVSDMTVVLAADSTVSGKLLIGGDGYVLLSAAGPTLTVAAGGRIQVGGPDMSYWDATLGDRDGNCGRLVNYGTIDVYGDLWFENVSGVNYLFIAEVNSREELFEAMDDIIIRQVVFTNNVTLLPGDAFQGRGMQYEIPENITVTLDWDEDHQDGKPIFLLQGATLRVNGVLDVKHAFYAYAGIETPEGEQRDKYIIGENLISYMKNFADFGEFVCNAVGDRLTAVTDAEIKSYGDQDVDEWPGGDWQEHVFAFLVKYGGVQPLEDEYNIGRVYWPTWEPITYGDAMAILENLWKAICGADEPLPASVCLENVIGEEHMDDARCEALLGAFAAALPKVADTETTDFTVVKDQEQVISNKSFSKPITISCDKTKTNDTFGGDIEFNNCAFPGGVTVEMTGGIGYNVRLNNSCTGAFTVIAEDDVIGQDRTNVSFFGMNGVTVNGLHIDGEIANVEDNDFNVNVRYDKEGENSYISTVEIRNSTENLVTVTGTYTGKLRVAGKLDISGVTLGENSRIELSNQCDAEINLGSNNILVNDDCGGEYSFSGTGEVYVPNQNQYAQITVNDVYLGTPHIFGRDGFGIFLPLESTEGITFTVEQGNNDLNCTTTKTNNSVELRGDSSGAWITEPNNVRVTVKVTKDEKTCTVVYDTMMWKPVQFGEFVVELNQKLSKTYTLQSLGLTGDEEKPLTFGDCKTAFEAIWVDFGKTDPINMNTIINDSNYWNELEKWTGEYQEAQNSGKQDWINDVENRNPDNWTRRWNDLDMMLDALINALDWHKTSPAAAAGWSTNDGIHYYKADGTPVTGWQSDISGWEGSWFYFYEGGAMATSWKSDIPGWAGSLFYFDPITGAMATGLKNDIPGWEGSFYFDQTTGVMATGWKQIDGKYYYFDPTTGAMATGEQQIGGNWYFFDPTTGAMATDQQQTGGNWFFFD